MYRLSIVDDDTVLLSLLQDLFELRSWSVTSYDEPSQALQAIRQQPPDAMLIDVLMPGMNGFELCKELRSSQELAKAPIFLMSAKHSISELTKAMMAGADEYVIKPFQPDEMHELLLSVMNKKNKPLKIKQSDE